MAILSPCSDSYHKHISTVLTAFVAETYSNSDPDVRAANCCACHRSIYFEGVVKDFKVGAFLVFGSSDQPRSAATPAP